jgi:hypothetical protein
LSLGPDEQAAADLGIAPDVAVRLQRIAQETVAPDTAGPRNSRRGEPARQRWRFEQHQCYGGADGDR